MSEEGEYNSDEQAMTPQHAASNQFGLAVDNLPNTQPRDQQVSIES